MNKWNLLTRHAQALIYVAGRHLVTTEELAQAMGTSRNRVCRIMADLTAEGYIVKKRDRQKRNLLALSQGVSMLCGGDEISRSQQGNNNAYC